MNTIFRVVWNHSTQTWVAASELSKSKTKSTTGKSILKNIILLGSLFFAAESACAAITPQGNNAKNFGIGSIIVGDNANFGGATAGEYNTLIGNRSRVGTPDKTVQQSIAIGSGGNPLPDGMPRGAWAKGTQSIAIGGDTVAEGDSSIAIGGDDVYGAIVKKVTFTNSLGKETTDSIQTAFRNLTGKEIQNPVYRRTRAHNAAIALGMKAEAADLSISIGTLAETKKVNTVAIGSGATADKDNSVALGGGSTTDNAGTKQTHAKIGALEYSWSGGKNTEQGDIVSFGKTGFERQLKNVAPGEVSQTSTDAVNGSQLYGIASKLVTANYLKYAGDDGQKNINKIIRQSLDDNRLNLLGGASGELTDNNIGVNNINGNLHIKLAKKLTGLSHVGVGSVAISDNGISAGNKPITHVAAGIKSDDAVNKSQLENTVDEALAKHTWNIKADKDGGVLEGRAESRSIAAGNTVVLKAGKNLKLKQNNQSFTYTLDSQLNGISSISGNGTTVSFLSDSIDLGNKKISRLAAGTEDSDAVNVAQLNALKNNVAQLNALKNSAAQPLIFGGDNEENDFSRAPGSKVELKGGAKQDDLSDNNIGIISDKNKRLNVKLAKSLNGLTSAQFQNEKGNTASLDAEGLKIRSGKTVLSLTSAGLNNGGMHIRNIAGNLPSPVSAAKEQSKPALQNTENHNAASVGDVLNSGWNIQENHQAKDFVRSYDTIDFTDGANTKASVSTDAQGKTNRITFHVTGLPIAYIDEKGNPLVKVGEHFYLLGSDGKPVLTDKEGNPVQAVNPANIKTALIHPAASSGETGKAGALTNIDSGLKNYTAGENGKPDAKSRLINLDHDAPSAVTDNTAATVGDIRRMGWIVSSDKSTGSDGNPYKDTVQNADEVEFVGTGLAHVSGTSQKGKRIITIDVQAKNHLAHASSHATRSLNAPAAGPRHNTLDENDAASVGDVLNAGWNLRENGSAVDFVKPYDTVDFEDGGNTVVTSSSNGKTSHIQINVSGLPITNTVTDPATGKQLRLTKVGNTYYTLNEDGSPAYENGKKFMIAGNGKIYAADQYNAQTGLPKPDARPIELHTNLVNPNIADNNEQTNTPHTTGQCCFKCRHF